MGQREEIVIVLNIFLKLAYLLQSRAMSLNHSLLVVILELLSLKIWILLLFAALRVCNTFFMEFISWVPKNRSVSCFGFKLSLHCRSSMRTRHLLHWIKHFQISCLFELWCWILERKLCCSCSPTNRLWFLFVWAKISCYPLIRHRNHNIHHVSVLFLIIELIAMPCRHWHNLVWSIVIRDLFTEHF